MQALQIAIPRWNITELNGYEPITTFWQDFSIADKFGNNAMPTHTGEPSPNGKTTTSIGRNFALSSITRYGSGTRETTKEPSSMTNCGGKRMQ